VTLPGPLRGVVRAVLRAVENVSLVAGNLPRREPREYRKRPSWDLLKAHHIAARVGNGDRVLDVGCGSGHTLAELALFRTIEPLGVDLALDRASNSQIPIQEFDGRTLAFPDDSFDVVLAGYVLHHLDRGHATELLAEMVRVARRHVILLEDSLPTFGLMYRIRNRCHRVEAGLLYDAESAQHSDGGAQDDSMFLTHEGWREFLSALPGVNAVAIESMSAFHKYKHHTLLALELPPAA